MGEIVGLILFLIGCYVVGSIPFGYLTGKLWAKVDIRQSGSGNIGATNVLRTLGALPALLVLVLDAAKGWVCVALAIKFGFSDLLVAGAALAVVAGHNWSLFLKLKGGRGVATALGILVGLAPYVAIGLVVVFALVVTISRYVSLGSIIASALLPVGLFLNGLPTAYIVAGVVLGFWSIIRHLPNIQRLLAGTENRFGTRVNPRPPAPPM